MRAVHQRLEIPTPAIFGVQRLPVRPQRGQSRLVPDYLACLEKVQIDGASLEVDRVEGLGSAGLDVNGLLLGGPSQFSAGDHEALGGGVFNQFAGIQQKCRLFLAQAHFGPPDSCLMVSSLSLEPLVVPNSNE